MKILTLISLILITHCIYAQTAVVRGVLQGPEGEAIAYANVALFNAADSSLYKVGASNDAGIFEMPGLGAGNYFLKAVYLGLNDLQRGDIALAEGRQLDLGVLNFTAKTIALEEATVSATRALVEIKPDRTIFNVTGTINSVGSDAISLLRKAPGVTVDNNDNISVLGRAGVLLYVDGKRLPLTGQDLTNYLQNLTAEQIDRIEIITNPGARYEAEGNAGIIDIRLKKDKNLGANGSVNATFNQGRYHRANLNGSGNYRNKRFNTFGTMGVNGGRGFNDMAFLSYQNGLVQDEINNNRNDGIYYNYRAGADFFLAQKHTLGFLASGGINHYERTSYNRITLAQETTPADIDSILVAHNLADNNRNQQTYNLNYRFDNNKGRSFNVDLDYGNYRNKSKRYQPNRYYDASEQVLLTEVINRFDTPTDIDISTLQLDYEDELWGGKLGLGSKLSRVVSDNTFLYYDELGGVSILNDTFSNYFKYNEKVYAGYMSYSRGLGKKWNFSAGLRAEKTDATGDLKAFLPELQEDPVMLNYLSWFPSLGLTWEPAPKHNLALNAGRRINRPDYNVLNPFNNRISELSYEKGNPFLQPEIVNNIELGYTLAYRYNFKLAYSRTTDQITRLIAPDTVDSRAGFITWANLADQKVFSFNISAPVQIFKSWNAYFNISASHINNQADYGDGAVVDVQAFTYNIYQQHTFDLPFGFKGEVSGYFSGPGVWGGVFIYESSWSLDLGLQRKFLNDRLNVRLSVNDLFYEQGWDGVSSFNGLVSSGYGRWDSRRASLSLGYRFGNEQVKSRKRSTGIEAEAGRVGE
ncbi:MAG: TonB-dependent receptor [Lewinellaceae bacterium]|nr:TonB-dependent receptor [Lewinellaceae bacterium]